MSIPASSENDIIDKIANSVKESECILIGGGAGLSASAGIDYTDTATFRRLFPKWAERGYRMQYEFIGFEDWTDEEKWAYWATHVNYVFYEFPPSSIYQKLHAIVKEKDFYVITSNADGLFIKSGFPPDRVFQAQGNYERMNCTKACTDRTWDTKPIIDRILANIDHEKFAVNNPGAMPVCPNCGAPLFVAFRRREEYPQWASNFKRWVNSIVEKPLTVFEIGVGFNTPGVIRWPFEQLVYVHDNVLFVRVNSAYNNYANTAHPQLPVEIRHKSISIEGDAGKFIDALYNRISM
jgi:NAD-dependent SIR2 family protein deacetylase